MTQKTPAAFMSYAHSDNKYGQLTTLRERLSDEVQMLIGIEFPIFQDLKDIHWGQNWSQRIETSLLDEITFLIPIITPGFFNSKPCREELERFLGREEKLERNDLILPIYYVDTPLINEAQLRAGNKLAELIASRQHVDWRELRHELFTSPQVSKALERLAMQIRDALSRFQTKPAISTKTTSLVTKTTVSATEQGSEQLLESPTPKKEPPTFIVDPWHRGDFASLTEAINTVAPGTRILVQPGLYQEGLVIDKPLEIIGIGAAGEIVIQAEGRDVILFQTTMGRVVNLTLRQMGGGKWFCVDIAQGRLEIEDCDLTSQGLACVAIHGRADPRLQRNRIHNSNQSGVFVYENAQGTIEDNDIFDNTLAGVSIKEGANPTLRNNRIHGNTEGSGILVHQNARGILEDNEVFDNGRSGVAIREEASPILRRNRIHDNTQVGIFIENHGLGTLEDNDIFGNKFTGVEIRNEGNPVLRRNRIYENKFSGLYVNKEGRGTIEQNDIFANGNCGITSESGGNPIIKNNRINKNWWFGIRVYQNGRGTFEDNDLTENRKGAWSIDQESAANVTKLNNQE